MRLTRENFQETGERLGAYECWELTAPLPELRFRKGCALRPRRRGHGFVRARLGDVLIAVCGRVVVI